MTSPPPPVKARETSCEDCLFAQWFNGATRRRQVGCGLNRLTKYVELGLVREMESPGGAHFVVTNGAQCRFKRTDPWGEELSRADQVAKVEEECRVKVAAIVVLDDQWTIVARDALEVAADAYDEVIAVCNGFHMRGQQFLDFVGEVAGYTEHPSFQAVQMVGAGTVYEAIDEGVGRVKSSSFYTVLTPTKENVQSGELEILRRLPKRLSRMVNQELMRFVALVPDEGLNGLTVHVLTHRKTIVGGNKPMEFAANPDDLDSGKTRVVSNVGEKLRLLAEAREEPWLVERLGILEPDWDGTMRELGLD